nr:hypothetical protein [uncultured Albidiferax sp.]
MAIDWFFAASWWWHLRFRWAERELAQALEFFGEDSLEVRWAHARWGEMDFAVRYGRPANGLIRAVVEGSAVAGASVHDLRLMLLNNSIRNEEGRVSVCKVTWQSYLLGLPMGLVCLGTQWFCMQTIAGAALSWEDKAIWMVAIGLWYLLLWQGWSLFYFRPLRAAARTSVVLESIAIARQRSAVISFAANLST